MDNQILFTGKLRAKVGVLLESIGFEVKHVQIQPFESIRYERKDASLSNPDIVSFHGLEPDYDHNYIYSIVVSGKKELAFLQLRALSDNFSNLKYPDTERWVYNSEEDLEAVLNEITNLVEHKLFNWFDDPSILPALSKSSTADRKKAEASLRKQIETYEEIAHDLLAKGEIDEAKRFEEAAKQYRKHVT